MNQWSRLYNGTFSAAHGLNLREKSPSKWGDLINCNALDENSVKQIRESKKSDKPFSIIAHDKNWIYRNFDVKKHYIQRLPGPFTFILKQKKIVVPYEVNLGFNTLGVRIPNHPFTKLIQQARVPFITTSVNKTGKDSITKIKKVPRSIQKIVDIGSFPGSMIKLLAHFYKNYQYIGVGLGFTDEYRSETSKLGCQIIDAELDPSFCKINSVSDIGRDNLYNLDADVVCSWIQ